jgi:glycosyltransferase involved in cell wall biosynthesis
MKIFGFLIARNEADIIGQVLQRLLDLGCYERIYFFDNDSTDDTLAAASALANEVLQVSKCSRPYSDSLKYQLIDEHRAELTEGDWLHVLDADEILIDNPRELATLANYEGANTVEHGCLQFYFVGDPSEHRFDSREPAPAQVKHYLLNYGEPRFFRFSTEYQLSESFVKQRNPRLLISSHLLHIQHFQFRSAEQVQRRIEVRLANNRHSGNWGHVKAARWQDYCVPARFLHKFDGQIRRGLPTGVDLFTAPNNAAYTAASLNWMRRHGHLTAEHERYFTAGAIERRLRSLHPRRWLSW